MDIKEHDDMTTQIKSKISDYENVKAQIEAKIPAHYHLFMTLIEPQINLIRESLKHPPIQGKRLSDVSQSTIFTDNDGVKVLTAAIKSFACKVINVPNASDDAVRKEAGMFGDAIRYYLSSFDQFRSHSFPYGYEEGHLLMANILAKPLNDLLNMLERLYIIVTEPQEAVKRYGSFTINLSLTFDVKEEVQKYNEWCKRNNYSGLAGQQTNSGEWFWPAVGGFLLGEWSANRKNSTE